MEDKREVSLERVEKFKKDRGIMFHFETSAKTGENIENLFIFASKVLYHNFKDKMKLQIITLKRQILKKFLMIFYNEINILNILSVNMYL